MPGRRNLKRELARHDQHRRFLHVHALLRTQLPARDRALVGQVAIVAFFHSLGLTRLNGGPLTWRIVKAWRTVGCPILAGNKHPAYKQPALSTTFALTAWMLSLFNTGNECFRVSARQRLGWKEASPPMPLSRIA